MYQERTWWGEQNANFGGKPHQGLHQRDPQKFSPKLELLLLSWAISGTRDRSLLDGFPVPVGALRRRGHQGQSSQSPQPPDPTRRNGHLSTPLWARQRRTVGPRHLLTPGPCPQALKVVKGGETDKRHLTRQRDKKAQRRKGLKGRGHAFRR